MKVIKGTIKELIEWVGNYDPVRRAPMKKLIERKVIALDMPLLEFQWKGVTVYVAEGDDWATIYLVQSENEGKGECQELLKLLKKRFKDKDFGGSVALNPIMRHIYRKLKIPEYQ
jgi:hypothetical protein